jgi:predicted TPR repeat methyltransferase
MARSAADWLAEADGHYDAQRWDEAGIAFDRALALDASLARAWYRLGNVREEQGRDLDAEACFEKAVALDPTLAQAWNNLGGARQRLGRAHADEAYRRAMAADPRLTQPYLNLGRLAVERGDQAGAVACFGAALEQHPGDPTFEHLLAAARGRNTAIAPPGYVTTLFDGIAAQFEHHLVSDLEYRVPADLAALVRPGLVAGSRVMDLGCGTGLIGAALAGTGARVTGVDLSPRMLEISTRRGVYEQLELGDVVEVMRRSGAACLQAVFAADVFIYLGNLEAVFGEVARALAPGGLFAFSVEGTASASYQLLPTGRYAHSTGYLRALAARHGLAERHLEPTRIRRQGAGYANGSLAVFAKPA